MFAGASTRGGGGGGGRIALYHTDENHFSGQTLVHGGSAPHQYGGSGTLYVEDQSNVSAIYRTITADNNGFTSSARIHTTRELIFQYPSRGRYEHYDDYVRKTSLRSYANVSVATSGAVWRYHAPNSAYYYDYGFAYISDGSLAREKSYVTSAQLTNVSLTFPYPTLLSHLHVFPLCRLGTGGRVLG